MKSGKVWGETMELLCTPAFEAHWITVAPGGHCSQHKHATKFNAFIVSDGILTIEEWRNGLTMPPDTTDIASGECCVVPPGIWHRFRCTRDCGVEAIEIYWAEYDTNDIDRNGIGGIA